MEQAKALAILKSGRNAFLTGSAGSGKTYVLNQYIRYLKDRKVPVGVTASTGIAATHMNGMTIHAWSGIGVRDVLTRKDLTNMATKKYLKDHLEKVKVLIVDEISMLHKNQLELVNTVLQYFKVNNEAFGGVQVVFCGDFFQLPPIGMQGELSRDKFAFMSAAWLSAQPKICYLTEQHRQGEDPLTGILNEMRTGSITQPSLELLDKARNHQLDEGGEPTRLFTHNRDVDRINLDHLEKLTGRGKTYKATTKGNKKLLETLQNSVLTEESLRLKTGAKVMFVKNNFDKGFVNGTMGKVIGFSEGGMPEVRLMDGKILIVEPEVWSVEDDTGKTLASFSQIPVRLAWAITVHKSQGMTLDSAEVDLGKTFEKGQGYVALSRLKSLETLLLKGLNQVALQVDGLALKADHRFQELSGEADDELQLKALEEEAVVAIKRFGGLTDAKAIDKQRKKKTGKKSSKSTYEQTKELMEKGMTLVQIANERGMSLGTITGHIGKISELFPGFDLSAYRPAPKTVQLVKTAIEQMKDIGNYQTEDGKVRLKPLYDQLKGKVSYADLKLVLAFMEG